MLVPSEKEIFKRNGFILTNKRVILTSKKSGKSQFQDITLEHIAGMEFLSEYNLGEIIFGIVLLCFGLIFLFGFGPFLLWFAILVVASGIAVIIYSYFKRQKVLTIYSDGGLKIVLPKEASDIEVIEKIRKQCFK